MLYYSCITTCSVTWIYIASHYVIWIATKVRYLRVWTDMFHIALKIPSQGSLRPAYLLGNCLTCQESLILHVKMLNYKLMNFKLFIWNYCCGFQDRTKPRTKHTLRGFECGDNCFSCVALSHEEKKRKVENTFLSWYFLTYEELAIWILSTHFKDME